MKISIKKMSIPDANSLTPKVYHLYIINGKQGTRKVDGIILLSNDNIPIFAPNESSLLTLEDAQAISKALKQLEKL